MITKPSGTEMQTLTIQATTPASARALFDALSRFRPRWTKDDEGRQFVSVQLGGDKHVVAVFDAIQKHVAESAQCDPVSSATVALDGS